MEGSRCANQPTIVGLLVIMKLLAFLAFDITGLIHSIPYDPGLLILLVSPLVAGIILIWGPLTNHIKWSLIIVGIVSILVVLMALVPLLITLVMYLPYLLSGL
jgi:hypothetical protein